MMKLRHKFAEKNKPNYFISENRSLIKDDYCVNCLLIITSNIIDTINNSDISLNAFDYLNEKFSCLTDEEYIIKKLLE